MMFVAAPVLLASAIERTGECICVKYSVTIIINTIITMPTTAETNIERGTMPLPNMKTVTT